MLRTKTEKLNWLIHKEQALNRAVELHPVKSANASKIKLCWRFMRFLVASNVLLVEKFAEHGKSLVASFLRIDYEEVDQELGR